MRTRELLSVLVIISCLLGCSHRRAGKAETPTLPPAGSTALGPAAPARSGLDEIQRQYREEFDEMVFPEPGREPALGPAAIRCKGFPRTLRAIRAYDRRYETTSPEYARLIVLKGMIHLQSGRFRSASAIEPEIMEAAAHLANPTRSDGYGLLARNFKYLMTGWREIYKHNENMKARDAGRSFPYASADFARVHRAADQINENLRWHAVEDPGAAPESDTAGLYVAAIAATFYTWVQRHNDLPCITGDSEDCPPKRRENKEKAVFYKTGRDLIGLFLTENEKSSADRGPVAREVSSGRERYLNWYGWLNQRVREASTNNRKKGVLRANRPGRVPLLRDSPRR
jgi:hypothetical protein